MNDQHNAPASSTAQLLNSLTQLRELVSKKGNDDAFAIGEGSICRERFLELRRLERSLDQYQSRTGQQLIYVGLLGHFSAGKSSTINALLADPDSDNSAQRATGQHPTDRAVTLITHSDNSQCLIGMHRRGEVEVGASLQDNALLRETVLVDTPGSGDPLIVEEMVRDFLPICDHLLYVFSAAVPLDTTDLPILQKAQRELPFIPMRFVITRADEFKINHELPLTEINFDQHAADQFVGEFISRLEAAISGLEVKREDFVMIDNRSKFHLDALQSFVKGTRIGRGSAAVLHMHKLRYFANSASSIHKHFIGHLKGTLSAQQALLKAAKDNHARYQKTVAMSHSRLTENWQLQLHELSSLRTIHHNALSDLAFSRTQPDRIEQLPAIAEAMRAAASISEASSVKNATALCSALDSNLQQDFRATRDGLIESIKAADDPEVVALTMSPSDILHESEGSIQEHFSPTAEFNDALASLPKTVHSELTALHAETVSRADALAGWLAPDRLAAESTALLNQSEQQLSDMLDGFLESVDVYKAAVLSLNARELAERAGVVRALDALEKVEISTDKRESWLRNVVQRIFPDRLSHENDARSQTDRLRNDLEELQEELRTCTFNSPTASNSPTVAPVPASSKRALQDVLQDAAQSFQQRARQALEQVSEAKEESLAEHKVTLMETVARLREERTRICRTFGAAGAIVGLILFFLASTVLPLFQPFSVFSFGIGIVLIGAGIFGGFQLAGRIDRSKSALDSCCGEYRIRAREILQDSLATLECPDSKPTQAQESEIAGILNDHWLACLKAIAKTSAEKHRPAYDILRTTRDQIDTLRNETLSLGETFYRHCEEYFEDADGNLEQLAAVSSQIKEDAILPSFRLFEDRTDALSSILDSIQSIHFEAEHTPSEESLEVEVPA